MLAVGIDLVAEFKLRTESSGTVWLSRFVITTAAYLQYACAGEQEYVVTGKGPQVDRKAFVKFLFFFSPVLDDEDSNNITAGSIVTVTVTLTRKTMAVSLFVHLTKCASAV